MAAALLFAGCGGDDGEAEVASAGGTAAAVAEATEDSELSQDEQALAFAECLRENGLDVPDPEPGQRGGFGGFGGSGALGDDVDEETFQAAMEACRGLAPTFDRERDLSPEQQEQLLELTECLRDQGIDVPDPGAGGFGGGTGLGDVDRDELMAAREACREQLDLPSPTARPGAGT
ncbi:hypothetical protein DY240_13425 [Jiangella rhizosphaerae]|uniref:Uncharacterized protein n=2 Tax=Jiangella rhizosphaerae TaxID=2293569 RepID=A0A418KR31_9ACTN|nr:hypothetical protein DY240_13425 [Jiangella rhizosphaerae]